MAELADALVGTWTESPQGNERCGQPVLYQPILQVRILLSPQ